MTTLEALVILPHGMIFPRRKMQAESWLHILLHDDFPIDNSFFGHDSPHGPESSIVYHFLIALSLMPQAFTPLFTLMMMPP